MSAESPIHPNLILRRVVQLLGFTLAMTAVLLVVAGDWRWLNAWLLIGLYLAVLIVNALLFLLGRKDLIEERGQVKENVKDWDKRLTRWMALVGMFGPLAVAALDHRFGWSGLESVAALATAVLVYLGGYALASWAMYANRFFSTHVRIQRDRGHQVVDTGPYTFVRHPGYLGMILSTLATPFVLNSLWALVPALIGCGLVIIRTALEDRTLQAELPGYRAFTQKTRYRLLPGVW
ncbi:MAG TPA: isoprenylcysteine carboxylmethyltransferase family protein [Anaerolineaceae bacterium]|nr:isoprenylcysteine carboxylmethyltransferase family protein [Anaerolineaceae bacterium]